ncbi:MAG: long-chain fatty acid--CoA ligase [Cyanobacteria bacterium SIG32]|nr:long-chain fatty acid--CoA ligase [Cyanobacteria bacterium SIG32]
MEKELFCCDVSYSGMNSLAEVLESCMEKFSTYQAITDKYNNIYMTYGELKEEMNLFAIGLQTLGVKKGDKVGLFAESNGLWMATSLAIQKCGAVDVIRGSNAPLEELHYITAHADCKGLILRDEKLYNLMKPFLEKYRLDFIIVTYSKGELDTTNVKSKVYTHKDIIQLGKDNEFVPVEMERNDDCSILYTSGTTGNPKGVLLNQESTIYQLEIAHRGFQSQPGENTLQILPIWHAYERVGQCYYISRGCNLHYTTLAGLKNDLATYEIHTFMSVPRIWESIRTGVYQKLKQTSPILYNIFDFAIKTSISYKTHKMYGERRITNKLTYNTLSTIRHRVIRSFIKPLHILFFNTLYKKIKKAVGLSNIRASISGGGALSMQDELFYDAIGINLRIGYGLTETAPVLTLRNVTDKNFLGAAGTPVDGTDLRIVDPKTFEELPKFKKGLVIVKGPQIMKGYYKDEEATRKVFTEDGYFITGDLGWLTNENNLVLVGRLKETIVLSSGENVEPVPIEEAILLSPYIDQIVLVGQDRSGVGALVVPSKEALEKCGITMKDLQSYKDTNVLTDAKLENLIKNEINTHIVNKPNLRMFEKVKQFTMLNESFSVENGLMSATQKVKRNKVFEKYEKVIGSMYK